MRGGEDTAKERSGRERESFTTKERRERKDGIEIQKFIQTQHLTRPMDKSFFAFYAFFRGEHILCRERLIGA